MARSAKIIFGRVMASDLPAVEKNLPPAIAGGAWFIAKNQHKRRTGCVRGDGTLCAKPTWQ